MEEQKARLEDQRGRLEAELREQFRRDITALRGEMAEVSRQMQSQLNEVMTHVQTIRYTHTLTLR